MSEFSWKRQLVTRCQNCPAYQKHGARCNLHKERQIFTPLNAPPPEWCPLRATPIMLLLQGTGWGEKK